MFLVLEKIFLITLSLISHKVDQLPEACNEVHGYSTDTRRTGKGVLFPAVDRPLLTEMMMMINHVVEAVCSRSFRCKCAR